MKFVLVVLAAVLFFCSFHACATSTTDIQKRGFPKLNMRFNNLVEGSPAVAQPKTLSGTVTGNFAARDSISLNGKLTGTVTGTVTAAATSGKVDLTGSVTCEGTATASGGTVTCTVAAPSGGTARGGTLTGKLQGTLTGNGNAAPVTDTLTCSVTAIDADPLTCEVTGAGTGTTNGITFSGSLTSAKDAVKNTGKATRGAGAKGDNGGKAELPATAATTTTTEAPETTTTSTASPTDAPQPGTEKPTNPTEGKTDSSNSHVASHVALFIGTIALLSVV